MVFGMLWTAVAIGGMLMALGLASAIKNRGLR